MRSVLLYPNLKLSILITFISIAFNVLFAFSIVYFNVNVAKREPINQNNLLLNFAIAVFVAPVVEELMFRLPLLPNKKYCLISICFIFFGVIRAYISETNNHEKFIYFLSWLIVILLYYYLSETFQFEKSYYVGVFSIISSIFFAYAHIYNFKLNSNENVVLTLLPIFILGILLSYVRIKAGIGWSIFTHCLINFFPMGLAILLKHFKFI